MTAEDYDDAVHALAVLIAKHERRRNQKQRDTDDDHEDEAPLP